MSADTTTNRDTDGSNMLATARETVDAGIEVLLRRRRAAWPLAIMRVAFGLIVFAWTVTLAFDANDLLGSDALVPPRFATQGRWNWFDLDATGDIWVALVVLMIAAVCIVVGWRPTEWLLLTFLVLVAVQRRNPVILNSGDLLLRNFALLLALCPTGAALSVDRWRRFGRDALRTAPLVAPWGLRLIQLQMMLVYFFAFWSKSGGLWRNGTAVSTVFRLDDLTRLDAPDWLIANTLLIAAFTWGTLAIEVALATLLWHKPLRPVMIALAVVLHLSIDVFVLVGFFGPIMLMGLVSFSDPDRWGERLTRITRTMPR
jgi:hypothetical protein